jgi:hypothetical protein
MAAAADRWRPGARVGEIIATPRNPVFHETAMDRVPA